MITLIQTPTERRLVRSKTKNQAIDFVVRGTILARSVSADELVDLLRSDMKVEDADDGDVGITPVGATSDDNDDVGVEDSIGRE